MDRIALLLTVAAAMSVATVWSQPSLLPDSDFESGLAPWGCHQEKEAKRSAGVEAIEGAHGKQAAKIVIEVPGQSNHVQFTCNFDSSLLTAGEVYRLRFLARAENARGVYVCIIGANRPWGNVGLGRKVELGAEWERYELPFRAKEPQQEQVKVDFFLGDVKGAVWIDDVRLERFEPAAREPDGPSLEGDSWEVSFSKRGAIQRITQKPGGEALVGGLVIPPAYELTIVREGEAVTVDSADAQRVSSSGNRFERRFIFAHEDFTVTCDARRSRQDELLRLSLRIENSGRGAITAVKYPVLNCPVKLGETSADDQVLYPRCDGGLIENPLKAMRGRGLNDTYPGPLSCQVMAYCDGARGLYVATHDAAGNPKRFGCAMGVDLELSVTHLLPIIPGADVELSYPVALGAFAGDWWDAAEIYRQWSRKQAWCAKTILEREDTPDWLKRGGLVTCYDPRAKDKDGKQRFDAEGLREFLTGLREGFGAPVIPNNRGWERYGTWTGQEYLPAYPSEEEFRRDAGIIRELGGQGMIMLSGFRWTIEKPQKDGSVYSSAERFEREVKPFVTYEPDGVTPKVFTSAKENDWRGTRYARLCPATEFAKQTVVDIARHCVASGYAIVHFDQEVSGAASTSFCGSREHGHSPGYGRWIHEALADVYRLIREECEPLGEDFALSMEEPNELYLPWLNLCQSRPNGLTNEFPIRAPMTRVAPLFSYLYHDYLVGWVAFYPWRSGGHPTYSLARGFSAGMMPGLHAESTYGWPEESRNTFNRMLHNCVRAYLGPAREYLMFGKMHRPPALDVPMRELDMGEKFGKTRVPAISSSVWELADGRRAVVLINPEQEDREVTLPGIEEAVTVPGLDVLVVELARGDE